eukprot:jgi/Bigna1/67168/fgenesh1_pg.3_\
MGGRSSRSKGAQVKVEVKRAANRKYNRRANAGGSSSFVDTTTFTPLTAEQKGIEDDIQMFIVMATTSKSPAPKSLSSAQNVTESVPQFSKQQSDLYREQWTTERSSTEIDPAYRKAFNMICLNPEWIAHTKSIAVLRSLSGFTEDRKDMKSALVHQNFFNSTIRRVIQKAYKLTNEKDAMTQKCIICGEMIYPTLTRLWHKLQWRRPYMTLGFQYWMHLGQPDELVAKLSGVTERGARCLSVQRQAFDLVVKYADFLVWSSRKKNTERPAVVNASDTMSIEDAREKCREIFEEWLASIMSTLGMQLPLLPLLNDTGSGGTCAFWHAPRTNKLWAEFKKPENFGRKFHAIPALKRLKRNSFGSTIMSQNDFFGVKFQPSPLKFATAMLSERNHVKKKYALYLERLCHFFTKEFFCAKAIAVLMQENADNPQLLGFRSCMEVIFTEYRTKEGVEEETFQEYVYDEENSRYDIDRVNNILWYVGITKDKVDIKERKQARRESKKQPVKRSGYKGSKELLVEVEKLVSEGKSQMQIFHACRGKKLGTGAEIFAAVQEANFRKTAT